MAYQSSGRLLHIEPQQFDALLESLVAKAPPKSQTAFSVKQVVARLYDFITRSLACHYSFDELAVMIQTSLVEVEIVGEQLEIKGSTLRQYFLEEKRERENNGGGRKTTDRGGRKSLTARSGKPEKTVTVMVEAAVEKTPVAVPDTVPATLPKRAPTGKSGKVELAY